VAAAMQRADIGSATGPADEPVKPA